jgi:hypothetical protein
MARLRLSRNSSTYSVIDDQPSVAGKNGRSSCADLEPFPGRHRCRQKVMRSEITEMERLVAVGWDAGVGDPNAFLFKVDKVIRRPEVLLLRTSPREEWPMKHGQFQMARGGRDC